MINIAEKLCSLELSTTTRFVLDQVIRKMDLSGGYVRYADFFDIKLPGIKNPEQEIQNALYVAETAEVFKRNKNGDYKWIK